MALLNALLDETISPEEHSRLCEHLRGNPQAIREYLSYVDLHTSFKELEERSDEELTADLSDNTFTKRETKYHWLRWAMVSAVAIALFVPLSLTWRRPAEPDSVITSSDNIPKDSSLIESLNTLTPSPVSIPSNQHDKATPDQHAVVLSQIAKAELFYERIPEVGSAIQMKHEYVLVKGLMELSFENGASAVFTSPAVFTVASPTRIEMKMGRCSVHAPETATGFEVVTPQGRVVDLGTRFSVVAREAGESDIQVVEGAVIYHPKSTDELTDKSIAKSTEDAAGTMLLEGEAVRLPEVSKKSEAIPFNRQEYQNQFPDRVVSYEAAPGPDGQGVRDLVSVTVQREGQNQTYPVEDLIGIDVIHFSAYSKWNSACSADELPARVDQVLTNSVALNAGLTNFDSAPGPYVQANEFKNFRQRHGLAVQFRQPVKNGPGPDVVLFELQSAAYPPGGDRFHVSPIEDRPGLKTHHVQQFDITMHSANALQVAPLFTHVFNQSPRSLDQLLKSKVKRSSRIHVPFHALAVGIDLSDLGYEEGASVPGVFIEDADEDDYVAIDVVFIGGLP